MLVPFITDRDAPPRSLVYQCPSCGHLLTELTEVCPGCGQLLADLPPFTYRPPITRAVKIVAVAIIVMILLGVLAMLGLALFPPGPADSMNSAAPMTP